MTEIASSHLKEILEDCISSLNSIRNIFCVNPESDFSRNRKISLPQLCQFLIQMQSKSLPCEALEFWNYSPDMPTPSALVQQREKVLPDAFDFLFHLFCEKTEPLQQKLFKGYRVLACDGSDVIIARNPADQETFIKSGEDGYNAIHINALFDLLNHTCTDVVFQGKKKLHEREAFNRMVDRSHRKNIIYVADRGYESYNTFEHVIRSGQKFVIRLKDIDSNGILASYNLPYGTFDKTIETMLTRRHTKVTMGNPDIYTILSPSTEFDFLNEACTYYHVCFRVVRFRTKGGKYVCVATNLSKDEFSLEEIRELYRMRWGEETGFRELKYTIGLVNFHSRKRGLIYQEIYARFILYNFCELVTQHTAAVTAGGTKHNYRINFTTAVNICRAYLKKGGNASDYICLIQKHLTPIRDNRKYARKLKAKSNRDFIYRPA